MNIQQMMMGMLNNSMKGMMGQNQPKSGLPSFNADQMKNYMTRISDDQLEQLKNQARSMGMTEEQIEKGVTMLNRLR